MSGSVSSKPQTTKDKRISNANPQRPNGPVQATPITASLRQELVSARPRRGRLNGSHGRQPVVIRNRARQEPPTGAIETPTRAIEPPTHWGGVRPRGAPVAPSRGLCCIATHDPRARARGYRPIAPFGGSVVSPNLIHGLAPVAIVQSPPSGARRVGASRLHGLAPVAIDQAPCGLQKRWPDPAGGDARAFDSRLLALWSLVRGLLFAVWSYRYPSRNHTTAPPARFRTATRPQTT